jgi:hypothetical protein
MAEFNIHNSNVDQLNNQGNNYRIEVAPEKSDHSEPSKAASPEAQADRQHGEDKMSEVFDNPNSPYYRSRRTEQRWTDVLQACVNGHIITWYGESRPDSLKKRCPDCGSTTITKCPNCHHRLPGHKHMGIGYMDPDSPPDHCDECGEPFPWREKKSMPASATTTTTNKAFIVHGHDDEMKQAVARTLSLLGLVPIILHEQPNEGKTIIEKFEKHADVGFAIILLSPDDMAYPYGTTPKSAKARARQNVILELGYFAAKLGRARVFPLYRDGANLELPSDIAGVIYNVYDAPGRWRLDLVRELKASEYDVDANKLV